MDNEFASKAARKYQKKDVLFTSEEIHRRVKQISVRIAKEYRTTESLVMLGVLNGAAIFTTDLMRELWQCGINPQLGYIGMSLFGEDNKRRKEGPRMTSPLSIDIRGKKVLVAEDIIDTGWTMKVLMAHLMSLGASRIEIVAILVNYGFEENKNGLPVKHVCFKKPADHFVAGYGMDNEGKDRAYPDIYRVPVESQPRLVRPL